MVECTKARRKASGGYRKPAAERLYCRLDCKSTLGFIAKGYYVKNRVFFADEAASIAAGHRPGGKCMQRIQSVEDGKARPGGILGGFQSQLTTCRFSARYAHTVDITE